MLTRGEVLQIMPFAKDRVDDFLPYLNQTVETFGIETPERLAAFLAQLAHESGELRYVEELATGDAYEGRADLGNTEPGDGRLFKGRGLVQITGKDNYLECSIALFHDDRLLGDPRILCEPQYACLSAGWYWDTHRLNNLADKRDMRGITRAINGGYNGLQSRLMYYDRALKVFDN